MPVTHHTKTLIKTIAEFAKVPEAAIWVKMPEFGSPEKMKIFFYTGEMTTQQVDRLLSPKVANYGRSFRGKLVRFLEENYFADGFITRVKPSENMNYGNSTPLKAMGGKLCDHCGKLMTSNTSMDPDNYSVVCRKCAEEQ